MANIFQQKEFKHIGEPTRIHIIFTTEIAKTVKIIDKPTIHLLDSTVFENYGVVHGEN